jgi:glycosyltransferase involved in cell wall biosynthesis
MSVPELSIVIPVYNEAGIVREAAEDLCRKLDALGWDYELLLAENGSRDGTTDILRALAAANPRIRWFHEEKADYGRALRHGILEARGRIVICDEIDLCDVAFYERALPLLAEGADLVVGSKAMRGADDARPWVRRIATRIITVLLRITTGFRGTDTHGLKAFVRERLTEVARACVVTRDLFASELVIRAQRMGRDVREIPIALREKRPPSFHLFRRVPRVLKGLVQLGWAIRVRHRKGRLLAEEASPASSFGERR